MTTIVTLYGRREASLWKKNVGSAQNKQFVRFLYRYVSACLCVRGFFVRSLREGGMFGVGHVGGARRSVHKIPIIPACALSHPKSWLLVVT